MTDVKSHFYLSNVPVQRLSDEEMIELGRIVTAGRKAGSSMLDPELDFTLEEREELCRLVDAGHAARNRLVEGNLPLAIKSGAITASKYGDSLDDAVGDALLGLIQGANVYDPIKYQTRFSTIAVWTIRGRMSDGRRSRRKGEVLSDGVVVLRDGGLYLEDEEIPDRGSPIAELEEADAVSASIAVAACLAKVDARSAAMLRLYHGLEGQGNISYREIGERYGITKERVRQILDMAMDTIRNSTSLKELEIAS